jgi:hypothetical protein
MRVMKDKTAEHIQYLNNKGMDWDKIIRQKQANNVTSTRMEEKKLNLIVGKLINFSLSKTYKDTHKLYLTTRI